VDFAAPPPPTETSNTKALILSALVHLVLIGALFFGVQWKSQAPSSVEVEVWRAVPQPVVRPEPVPEVKPETKPEPPKPVAKVEPAPTLKPDIAIKEDKKPKKEEPKKPEPKKEEPKKPEPKKEEPKRVEPDFKKELASEQKQLEQQKVVEEARNQAQAEAERMARLKADQASAARARGLADYAEKVGNKIRGNIVLPPNIQGNPEAVFIVTQLPTGEVLAPVRIQKSSGNPQLDTAIERAILKSSPLPKPDNPRDFDRELKIPYRPFE
jgi:colicin import membrane protein